MFNYSYNQADNTGDSSDPEPWKSVHDKAPQLPVIVRNLAKIYI